MDNFIQSQLGSLKKPHDGISSNSNASSSGNVPHMRKISTLREKLVVDRN
jgi:hypothetical protein